MTKTEKNRIRNALKHQYQVSLKFNGNIIVMGKDLDNPKKNIYYCIRHDEFFSSLPDKMLYESRKGCSVCSGQTKWTTESVVKRIQFLNQDKFGNNTLLIDKFDYTGIHQEIWLTCLIDGHRWKVTIASLIHQGTGCPECAGLAEISFDELHERNNEINTDEKGILRIIIKTTRKWYEENYKGNTTKIWVGCIDKDHPDWEISLDKLLNAKNWVS